MVSSEAWRIYERFDRETTRILGEQWIRSIDSIGANIAEGFGRYHFLDKNKFNYNARGSLLEALHWIKLLHERGTISYEEMDALDDRLSKLHHQLNAYIKSTKTQIGK